MVTWGQAAWADKWGLTSAGTEEAARTAGRQDLVASAFGATAAAQVFPVGAVEQQRIQGTVHLDGEQLRQLLHEFLPFKAAAFPTKQPS